MLSTLLLWLYRAINTVSDESRSAHTDPLFGKLVILKENKVNVGIFFPQIHE